MATHIKVPLVDYDGYQWAALAQFGKDHEIIGETFKCTNDQYSFRAGHRVRLFKVKKQVYWKIPAGTNLDISDVPARRVQGR
jgi:hypothetical protein